MKFQRTTTAVVEVEDERKVDGDRRKIRLRYKEAQHIYPGCRRQIFPYGGNGGAGRRAGDANSTTLPMVIERRRVENDGFGRRKIQHHSSPLRRESNTGRRKGDREHTSLPVLWGKTVSVATPSQTDAMKMEAASTEKPAPHYIVHVRFGFVSWFKDERNWGCAVSPEGVTPHKFEDFTSARNAAVVISKAWGGHPVIEKVTG